VEAVLRHCRQGGQGPHGPGCKKGREGGRVGHERAPLGDASVRHRAHRRHSAYHQHQLQELRDRVRSEAVGDGEHLHHRRVPGHRLPVHAVRAHSGAEDPSPGQAALGAVPAPEKGAVPGTREAPRALLHERGHGHGRSDLRRGVQGEAGQPLLLRRGQHAVHLRDHGVPQGSYADPSQHRQQRILDSGQHELHIR